MKNKKYFLLSVISMLLLALMFTGCSSGEEKPAEEQKVEETVEEKVEEAKEETKEETKEEEKEEVKEEVKEEESSESNELNIYSSRHYDVDKEVYDMFTEETGIKVNVVEGKSGEIMERLEREKDNPQADLLYTVGAESIYPLSQDGMLDNFESSIVDENVPENLRGNGWAAVMYRARVIAYEKDKTDPATINSYDDLTKDEYKGQILVRSSSSSYNVALLSSFIQMNGEEAAKEWAEKVVENMARKPNGNDRDQAKAIVAGEGDLAIMNSYYFVRMANSSDPAEVEVSEKIGLIFPEKTHINLSYAGVLTGAANKDNAVKFIEFVTQDKIQKLYAEKNGEFPVNPSVEKTEVQKEWGDFDTQDINFEELGKDMQKATMIFDEVNWE